jgi:hypothetical protein
MYMVVTLAGYRIMAYQAIVAKLAIILDVKRAKKESIAIL